MEGNMILLAFALFGTISILQAAYVAELTDDNFYDYVKDKPVVMVEFYAPWCSDCKNIEPEINRAADTLDRRGGDIVKVDCFGSGKGLCDMYRVKSWPQIKLFNKGNYIGDYTGAQTGDALALYVESMANNYETKAVPAPMDAFANSQQIPYQAPINTAAAVPAAVPMAAVPGVVQQPQQPQKPITQENAAAKVEAHAKTKIHKEKEAKKKNLNSSASKEKLKKIAKQAKKIASSVTKKIKKIAKQVKAKKQ